MTVKRYEKITEYFHARDRRTEPAWGTLTYDKLYKVREVIVMTKNNFKNNYKPYGHLTINEAIIKWTGRLSFKKYLPAKSIKRGIKVWMRCDSVNAFLTDFEIYLGKGTHEVVTRLTRGITGNYFRVYFDCPTDGGFVCRQNLRLWNCKNESKRVPG